MKQVDIKRVEGGREGKGMKLQVLDLKWMR